MPVKAILGHFFNFFTGKKAISRPLFGHFLVFFTGRKFIFTGTNLIYFADKLVFSRDILQIFFTCINFISRAWFCVKFHGQRYLFTGTFLRFLIVFSRVRFLFPREKKTLFQCNTRNKYWHNNIIGFVHPIEERSFNCYGKRPNF